MDNDSIMNVLLTYDNLKDLSYENKILTYQGKSISLENVPLKYFFVDSYSQMYIDQRSISASDFFNIMELHSKKIEEKANTNLNNQAINYLMNN